MVHVTSNSGKLQLRFGQDLGVILKNFNNQINFKDSEIPKSVEVMNKIIAVFIIMLSITGLCVLAVPNVNAESSDITILNYTWYTAPSTSYYRGDLIVVGEIQNTGSSVIDFVALQGIAYTTDGEIQAGAYTSAYAENLLPQQKAPFYIDFSAQSTISGNLTWLPLLDRVELRVIRANETSVRQYDGLAVVANTSYVDASGVYTVVGYLQNVGTQQSGKVWVVGTFYNAAGATIATGYTNYLVNYTAPGESLQFAVTPLDVTSAMSNQIAGYSLLIQSREPEASTATPTPSVSLSPTTSPIQSPLTSGQATPSPEPQQESSSTLVTALAATAVVIAVIVVVAFLLKKKPKPKP